jgi:basic amino acid/polyamine antiporter, APA family
MTELKRALGISGLSFYGIGLILGAGIYTILGRAAGLAGDALWMSFVLGSIAAFLTGLSYAELATMFPKSGAEYVYAREAWPKAQWLSGTVGLMLVASGTATAATVAIAFAGYASLFVQIPPWPIAAILLTAAAGLNIVGLRESSRANVVFTLVEMSGLVVFVVVGARDPDFGDALSAPLSPAVLAGASLIFFAFLGFEDIANLAEETKNPERNLPRAIFIAVSASTVLYVLVALASVALMEPSKLSQSKSPLADAMRVGAPRLAAPLGGVALFATANTALIAILAASRMLFGMARGGDAPSSLARLLGTRQTPALATLVVLGAAFLLLPLGRVELVGSVASLTALVAFVTVDLAVIRLRWSRPQARRPFRVPLAIGRLPLLPSLGAVLALLLMTRFELLAYAVLGGVALIALIVVTVARARRTDPTSD